MRRHTHHALILGDFGAPVEEERASVWLPASGAELSSVAKEAVEARADRASRAEPADAGDPTKALRPLDLQGRRAGWRARQLLHFRGALAPCK